METVLKAISDWIKSLLTAAIMSNLSGLFDDVNTQVGNIAQQVGTKPSSFEPRVFAMIEALSRNVVLPVAGVILTFIACYELIETSVYKGYKRDKIEMRGDRAEISDFPLYLNTVAGGLDCRDQAIGGFSFVVKIYAVPVVEIIG